MSQGNKAKPDIRPVLIVPGSGPSVWHGTSPNKAVLVFATISDSDIMLPNQFNSNRSSARCFLQKSDWYLTDNGPSLFARSQYVNLERWSNSVANSFVMNCALYKIDLYISWLSQWWKCPKTVGISINGTAWNTTMKDEWFGKWLVLNGPLLPMSHPSPVFDSHCTSLKKHCNVYGLIQYALIIILHSADIYKCLWGCLVKFEYFAHVESWMTDHTEMGEILISKPLAVSEVVKSQ